MGHDAPRSGGGRSRAISSAATSRICSSAVSPWATGALIASAVENPVVKRQKIDTECDSVKRHAIDMETTRCQYTDPWWYGRDVCPSGP